MIKILNKLSVDETYFKIMKAIYDRFTANIILKGENLKEFPLRMGTRMPTFTTYIQYNTGSPSQSNQAREIKGIQTRKEEVKLISIC